MINLRLLLVVEGRERSRSEREGKLMKESGATK